MRRTLFWSLFSIVLLLFFLLNVLTPLINTDLALKNTEWTQIFDRVQHDYMFSDGRVVSRFLLYVISSFPKILFDVINTVFLGLFTYFIYLLTTNKRKDYSIFRLLLIIFGIWIFTPDYGQVLLWESGAVTYLWSMTLAIGYLLIFQGKAFRNTIGHRELKEWLKYPLIIILGVMVGLSNLETSFVVLGATIFYIVISFKKQSTSTWMYVGGISQILGSLLLILSPSNKHLVVKELGRQYYDQPYLTRFLSALGSVNTAIQTSMLILIIITGITWVAIKLKRKDLFSNAQSLMFFVLAICSLYVRAFFAMGHSGRYFFTGLVFLIVSMGLATNDRNQYLSYLKKVIIVILVVVGAINFINGLIDIYSSYVAAGERVTIIKKEKQLGMTRLLLPKYDYSPKTKYNAFWQLPDIARTSRGVATFPNYLYADYYKVKGVQLVNTDYYNSVFSNGSELLKETNLNSFLSLLEKKSKQYYVACVGYGNQAGNLSKSNLRLLKKMKLIKSDKAFLGSRWGLVSVVNNRASKVLQMGDASLYQNLQINGKRLSLEVNHAFGVNETSALINFDGNDYSQNIPNLGLNFVIINASNSKVVDTVGFDITLPNPSAVR